MESHFIGLPLSFVSGAVAKLKFFYEDNERFLLECVRKRGDESRLVEILDKYASHLTEIVSRSRSPRCKRDGKGIGDYVSYITNESKHIVPRSVERRKETESLAALEMKRRGARNAASAAA